MRRLICLLAVTLISYAALAQTEPAKLRAGDLIRVVVVGHEHYTGEYLVHDDGSVSGVGFGRVEASGKTIEALEKEVLAKLSKRLRSPAVDVILVKQRPAVVYLVGSGETTGPVEFVPGMDLRQLLAARKLEEAPNRYSVTFSRRGSQPQTIDLLALLSGDPNVSNPELKPEDVVAVLPRAQVRVWVLGQVVTPGETSVEAGTDVYQAIAQAGGAILPATPTGQAIVTMDELRVVLRRGGEVIADLPARQDARSSAQQLAAGDVVVVAPPAMIRVTVSGEVMQPGEYVIRDGDSAAGAVAMARGVTNDGTLASVTVIRGNEAFRCDATEIGSRQSPFPLKAGDTVFVPMNGNSVYALGQVNAPGKYYIPENQELTASGLLALARGLSFQGSLRRVVLIRPDAAGKYTPRQFNLDEFLKDGKAESNPKLMAGDILLFGTPKGINLATGLAQVGQVANTALLIDTLSRR